MTNVDLTHFKALFLKTAKEYIEKMKQHNAILMKDGANKESINELHIASHSLKSQSLVMQYLSLGKICGVMEKIFRSIQDKKMLVSPELSVALQDAIQMIDTCITHIERDDKEIDLSYETQQLEKISGIQIV